MQEYQNQWLRWLEPEAREDAARLLGLGFSTRTTTCLINEGILSLDAICALPRKTMLAWSGFGKTSLAEVEAVMASQGLMLETGGEFADKELSKLLEHANQTRKEMREAGEAHKAALAAIDKHKAELKRT